MFSVPPFCTRAWVLMKPIHNRSAGKCFRAYILPFSSEPTPTDATASGSAPPAFLVPGEGALRSILLPQRGLPAERVPVACNPALQRCRSTSRHGRGQRPTAASKLPSAQFTPRRGQLYSLAGREKSPGEARGDGERLELCWKSDLVLASALFPREDGEEGVCQMAKGEDE